VPAGRSLGLLARFSLFRLRKDPAQCKDCNSCGADCQGAAEPQGTLRVSECMLCLNCVYGCPRAGFRYAFLPSPELTTDGLDLGRRRTLTAVVSGLVAVPLLRTSSGVEPRPHPKRIRPPGALPEEEFLERCVKCGVCMKACPTGGLHPAWVEAGLEGLWSPILVPRLGACEHECVLCTQVCPTGALTELLREEKVGKPPALEPVRLGSAFIDRGVVSLGHGDDLHRVRGGLPHLAKAIYFKEAEVQTARARA